MAAPRVSLVITTYERPDALAAVLATAFAQSRMPDEILVADDGSGPATRAVIERYASRSGVALRHLWQPHEGFRLTRVRNLAIRAARSEYLVFIDGDMLLHRHFIADHARCARRGYYAQGVRILLDAHATAAALAAPLAPRGFATAGSGRLRRLYACHAPRLAVRLRGIANRLLAIKGCNQAFWRDDLLAVNGYDERFVGWGPEDKELCARLEHYGVRRQSVLFAAIAWHLHHPPAARDRREANERLLADTLRTRRVRCPVGVAEHAADATREC
ncbi:MAG: glycosyltransferase family 2 protein [Steroidobacteraceae bacterium]|nr:glycosyltransferase family 2 protein [Steroidobacteraceae bacterium]MDW8258457.1 glycosyltransferase family 2 protein [Gammaproteobacteria bacterium]